MALDGGSGSLPENGLIRGIAPTDVAVLEVRAPVAETDVSAAKVVEAFPDEVYLAFLDDELTTDEFVSTLVAHVTGAEAHS